MPWIETGDELHPWEWVHDEPTEMLPTVPPLPRRVPGATVLPPKPELERPHVDDPVLTQPTPLPHLDDAPIPAAEPRYDTSNAPAPTKETPMAYAKTLVALLAAVLAAILPGLTDAPLGFSGVVNVIVLAAGAIQVYNASNAVPGWSVAKLVAAAVSAAGVVAISAWSNGSISPAEWVQMALAVLGALGVWAVPNRGATVVYDDTTRLAR